MNKTKNILLIVALPPPTTGQSLACELLLNSLSEIAQVNTVNMSKKSFKSGFNSLMRIFEIFQAYRKIYITRKLYDTTYFTVSESTAGNLKDILIYIICWRKLDRMIIHLHGGAGMRVLMSDKHPLLRAINSFFLKRLGGVIVLGERLKDIYTGTVSTQKLHAVPNFANNEFFVDPLLIQKKFSDTTPLRLLFLSNLIPGKGHEELLIALAQLPADQRCRLHVDFAGGFISSDAESIFRTQAKAIHGMEIHVHGVVHGVQKVQLLANAHLFCLPTYYPYEGQPISILEAYASGCAVITTDHSGIFDTFTPDVNGLEVEARSPTSIVSAILFALNNTEKLLHFAITNNIHANEKYRPSLHLNNLEKIIFSS